MNENVHIRNLFKEFGYTEIFGRGAVTEILGLKDSSASKLISKLVKSDVIEPIYGFGKGRYRFKER